MYRPTQFSRLAVTLCVGGALFCPPPSALAQNAPPPPLGAPPALAGGDPPARVGRIARAAGTVSFHGPGADHWDAATLNFPVTSGDALWTDQSARAAIDVSANRLTLNSGTELDIDTLDAASVAATEPQGELYLRLRSLAPGETYAIRTPRGMVTITQAGRYAIAAGDNQTPTTVTVEQGAAEITGTNLSLSVQAGQTASITGAELIQGSAGPEIRDSFLTAMLAEDAPPVTASGAPATIETMPGADDLAENGDWQPTPSYGTVWYPRVAAGWVPYREGHWAYVAPWGWTWVDDASWGFAPFHYGRWVELEGRWGWSPAYAGAIVEPIYAPALVSFVGFGAAIGVAAAVGWIPLGFGEPFHPWYGGSPNYVRTINRNYVASTTNVANVTNMVYANRAQSTVVPAETMVGSRPVAAAAQHLTPTQVASLQPTSALRLRPDAATAGVTPVVARQLGLPPAAANQPTRAPAPGPAIVGTTARHGPPLLLRGAEPAGARGAEPAEARGAEPAGAVQSPAAEHATVIARPGGPSAAPLPNGAPARAELPRPASIEHSPVAATAAARSPEVTRNTQISHPAATPARAAPAPRVAAPAAPHMPSRPAAPAPRPQPAMQQHAVQARQPAPAPAHRPEPAAGKHCEPGRPC